MIFKHVTAHQFLPRAVTPLPCAIASLQVASNGLVVGFLGGFDGVVSVHHLQTPSLHSTEGYHPKKKFRARVLWVDMAVKTIGLSLQKQVVSGRPYHFDDMEIGHIVEGTYISTRILSSLKLRHSALVCVVVTTSIVSLPTSKLNQ